MDRSKSESMMWPVSCKRMSARARAEEAVSDGLISRASARTTSEKEGRTLGLEVAVDEAHEVEVLERCDDLGGVELGVLLGQALARSRLQRAEELAAEAVLHACQVRAAAGEDEVALRAGRESEEGGRTEVQVVVRLERVVQGDDERVVRAGEDLLLDEDEGEKVSQGRQGGRRWVRRRGRTSSASARLTLLRLIISFLLRTFMA